MKKQALKLIFIISAMALLIGAVALVRAFIYEEPAQYVTVSFDTMGGTEVKPIKIVQGTTLDYEPFTKKGGAEFVGWYTDEARTQPFFRSTPINKNTTLYADFVSPDTKCSFYSPDKAALSDVAPEYTLYIESNERITSMNMDHYISADALYGDMPEFEINAFGNGYAITAKNGYAYNSIIRFTICHENVSFSEFDASVNTLTLRTKKNDPSNGSSALNTSIKYIDRADLNYYNSNYSFILPTSILDYEKIGVQDIICLGNGVNALGEDSVFIVVTEILRENNMCIITAVDCPAELVMNAFSNTFAQVISKPEYISVYSAEIAEELKQSSGVSDLSSTLASALTVLTNSDIISTLDADSPIITNSTQFNVNSLHKGLTITALIGESSISDFTSIGNNDWVGLNILFDYDATLSNGKHLNAQVAVHYYIKAIVNGTYAFTGESSTLDYTVDVYSRTDIEITAICDGVDISYELSELLSGRQGPSSNDVLERLQSSLGIHGASITLCDIPLLHGEFSPVSSLPLFNSEFDLDYSLSMSLNSGFCAGSVMTVLNATELAFSANTHTGEMISYMSPLDGNASKLKINSYSSGHLGLRSGIKGSFSVSAESIKKLGTVGVDFESGIYADIYGYAYINASGTLASSAQAHGPVYAEFGEYTSLKTVSDSDYFGGLGGSSHHTDYHAEKPILKIGEQYSLISLDHTKNSFITSGRNSGDVRMQFENISLLTGKYLDLLTGNIIDGSPIADNDIAVSFSNKYFGYDSDTGKIYVDLLMLENDAYAQGIDLTHTVCEADIHYIGSNSFASFFERNMPYSSQGKYASADEYKNTLSPHRSTICLVWLNSGVSYTDVFGERSVTATFKLNTGKEIIVLGTRQVIAGTNVGAFDLTDTLALYTETDGWDIEPQSTVITYDRTFTFHAKRKQTAVAFIYFNGSNWVGEVKAVNIGDTPTPSALSELGYGNMNFSGWFAYTGSYVNNPYLQSFYGIRKIESDIFSGSIAGEQRGTIYGYESGSIIDRVEGTRNYVFNEIYESAVNMGAGYYVAKYSDNTHPVVFRYTDDKGNVIEKTYNIKQGSDANIYSIPPENTYSVFVGWDTNNDGKVDYKKGERLPIVTRSQYYNAIYEKPGVSVYTYAMSQDGSYGQKELINTVSGESALNILSSLIVTAPPSTLDGISYEFTGWELSWDDKNWFAISDLSKLSVSTTMYFRPVFGQFVTLTFNASDGNFAGGIKTVEKKIPLNTTVTFSLLNIDSPTRASSSAYHYTMVGWRDTSAGGTFYSKNDSFISSSSLTLEAIYITEERFYTLNVYTEYGLLYDSYTNYYTASVTYDQLNELISYYTANLPDPVEGSTNVLSCIRSNTVHDTANDTVNITYVWEKSARITLTAEDTPFADGTTEKSLLISCKEQSLSVRDVIERFGDIVPDGLTITSLIDESGRTLALYESILLDSSASFKIVFYEKETQQ